MLDLDEYLAFRERPAGPPVMHQNWRDLLFLHFSVDPGAVQRLLPPGLTVDTYPGRDGVEKAWIGLVAFQMSGVRFHGMPAILGTSAFPETNVRTYVHVEGKKPGVWFFSLDAANALACHVARRTWGLPYHFANMSVESVGERVAYRGLRRSDTSPCNLECDVGPNIGTSRPGTLEFFLIERYVLYSLKGDRLWTGRVHHEPYDLHEAKLTACDERVVRAAGIEPCSWEHVAFSHGVDVEVFRLQPAIHSTNGR